MTATTAAQALNNRGILRAAMVVLLGFLASGILGVVRTAVFAGTFGASAELDAFYSAQQIPELLFTLVAGGALGSAFIPVFTRFLNDETDPDNTGAWRLASAVMTLSAGAAALLALLLALAAPLLVPALLVPGATAPQQAVTTTLTQLMLVTTVIFAVSGLLMGILNAHQSFVLPALALSVYNIGLILGALVFAPLLPRADALLLTNALAAYATDPGTLALNGPLWWGAELSRGSVYGLAAGAVLGALLHLLVQIPGLPKVGARLKVLFAPRIAGVGEVLRLMGPRVLGLAVVRINFIVNVAFASAMIDGSLTALNTAWFLTYFTLGVIAQSAGTAVFPTLSALAAAGDYAGFRDRLASVMRGVLFLALPATVGLMVLGGPVIAVAFERGAWTPTDTQATAWALAFYAFGIAGHSLLEVLARAFYALSDTWTPVRIGVAAMLANIALSVVFIQVIGSPGDLTRGPFAGLALANSLTTLVEAAVLWWLLARRVEGVRSRFVLAGAGRSLLAALLMGGLVAAAYTLLAGDVPLMVATAASIGVGLLSFFGAALLLGVEEARTVPRLLLRRGG